MSVIEGSTLNEGDKIKLPIAEIEIIR